MNEYEDIRSHIYEVRGVRVMLDSELAQRYGVETKYLNRAVKRNQKRFPEDFMFQLTKEELESLRCQIGTFNSVDAAHTLPETGSPRCQSGTLKATKYLPYAFTEQGVAMLSSVLRSSVAVEMSIKITRAFVAMRQMISSLPIGTADVAKLRNDFEELKQDIEDILRDQNDINESTRMQLDSISQALAELQSKEPRKHGNRIGFIQDDK